MSKLLCGGVVWLTRWVGGEGDPSLRLKSGSAQDDKRVGDGEPLGRQRRWGLENRGVVVWFGLRAGSVEREILRFA